MPEMVKNSEDLKAWTSYKMLFGTVLSLKDWSEFTENLERNEVKQATNTLNPRTFSSKQQK